MATGDDTGSHSPEPNEQRTSPIIDCHLIDVNITSSSPPETESSYQQLQQTTNKLTVARANSAKNQYSNVKSSNGSRGKSTSRKSSTITFQEPSPIIKRPNSTIGIPTSVIPSSQSLYTNFTDKCYMQYHATPHIESSLVNSTTSSNVNLNFSSIAPIANVGTPESETMSAGFSPVIREKASSLTLPDSKLQFLRKGSSNPFINTKTNGKCFLSVFPMTIMFAQASTTYLLSAPQ